MGTILEELRFGSLRKSLAGEEKVPSGEGPGKSLKGVYRCRVCGYIFDESLEGKPFSSLDKCPICKQGPGAFQQVR